MSTNESTTDRSILIATGLLLIALLFIGPKTAWGLVGFVPLLTGLVGYCVVYRLFKVST